MPSPYKTNCFNYNKIGCKSKTDCVDKCNIEMALKECNESALFTNMDRHNNKDIYNWSKCSLLFNYSVCQEKYKSPDCINEYFSFKPFSDSPLTGHWDQMEVKWDKEFNQNLRHINISKITMVTISFGDEPDTIYTHSPQQYVVEFICFIGGVISLWTGFSIMSMYAYGKRFVLGQRVSNQKLKSLFIKRHVIDSNC